jgi:hypothetical protein
MKRAAPGCGIHTLRVKYLKEEQPMKKIAYIDIDYHLNHSTIAVMIEGKRKLYDTLRIRTEDRIIKKYLNKLSKAPCF